MADPIQVEIVSAEEQEDGVAELWHGGRMWAMTLIDDGGLKLAPEKDAGPVGVVDLQRALEEAVQRLTV